MFLLRSVCLSVHRARASRIFSGFVAIASWDKKMSDYCLGMSDPSRSCFWTLISEICCDDL